jgi:hypothetical protein
MPLSNVPFSEVALIAQADTYQGSALASWDALVALMVGFAVVLGLLAWKGRPDPDLPTFERVALRIPDGLERITGIPGWAISAVGLALFGLLVAGQGFYSDVAWHVALGRDDELFTAPHTAIILGLVLIALSSLVGVLIATLSRAEVGFRVKGLRVPWSMLPLGALGAAAVSGFPLDELWHATYGIDVTMWSPTHMLMILGASFTGLAAWLVVAETGVPPNQSRWARTVHVLAAILVVLGLSAPQGEFAYGVPQYQAIFLPILVSIAGAFSMVAIRLVHGRGWALGIAVGLVVVNPTGSGLIDAFGDGSPVETRDGALYIGAALVAEIVALVLGTDRRLRYAIVTGLGVGTAGLAAEWVWNQGAYQPWQTSLLPDAVVLAAIAAVAAAVAGAAFAAAVNGERPTGRGITRPALAASLVAVLVVLALPMPRHVGDVTADVTLDRVGVGEARVHVTIDPDDVEDARWFQTMTWQNGGLVVSEMVEEEPGRYVSEHAHSVDGLAKTVLRLHRGSEMMAVPVYLPPDPEIDEREIPAVDRHGVVFTGEQDYLMREAEDGERLFAYVIYGLLALAMATWVGTFCLASARVQRRHQRDRRSAPTASRSSSRPITVPSSRE